MTAVQQTGSGEVVVPGDHSIPAHFRIASLHVEEVLKGSPSSADITVRYTILYSPAGWAGGVPQGYTIQDTLTPKSVRLVFLKSVGDHYDFTNGSYLSIVCAPEAQSRAAQLTLDAVVSRITAALFSPSVPPQEKARAIWQLRETNADSVIVALRAFLSSETARQDEALRTDAIDALLSHKDDSAVDAAKTELLSGSRDYRKANLLFAITRAVPPSRSIPILADVLAGSSAQMRTTAAVAIYQTDSVLGMSPLLKALDDPDPEVAFAIMQGLGNLTREYDWRPKSTQPDANWFACLNHWREYRQRSGP